MRANLMGCRCDRANSGEGIAFTSTRRTILIMGWVRLLIGGSLVLAVNLWLNLLLSTFRSIAFPNRLNK